MVIILTHTTQVPASPRGRANQAEEKVRNFYCSTKVGIFNFLCFVFINMLPLQRATVKIHNTACAACTA